MKKVLNIEVLPEEANVVFLAEYQDQYDSDSKYHKHFILPDGSTSIKTEDFEFLEGWAQKDGYSVLDGAIYVETILEDDLDCGEKGLVKVEMILTDDTDEADDCRKRILVSHNFVGKESVNTNSKRIIDAGILFGFDTPLTDSFPEEILTITNCNSLNVEFFVNSEKDSVVFLILKS